MMQYPHPHPHQQQQSSDAPTGESEQRHPALVPVQQPHPVPAARAQPQPQRPLSDGEWLERTFASVSLLLAGALFWGYSGAHGWPGWCLVLGILALGNGAVFTLFALLSWHDDHRTPRHGS